MKTFALALVLFLATFASAAESINNELDMEESPRFGFIDLNDSGTTLTFNSTSLQYAVVSGVLLIIVALVVVPLLGFDLNTLFSSRDSYDYGQYAYDQNQAYSSYSAYAQRSLDVLSPVLHALSEAYRKYQ